MKKVRLIQAQFVNYFGNEEFVNHLNILCININNEVVSSELEVANAFKKYFTNVASKLIEPINYSNFEYIKSVLIQKLL